jgi:hypothetical protein
MQSMAAQQRHPVERMQEARCVEVLETACRMQTLIQTLAADAQTARAMPAGQAPPRVRPPEAALKRCADPVTMIKLHPLAHQTDEWQRLPCQEHT